MLDSPCSSVPCVIQLIRSHTMLDTTVTTVMFFISIVLPAGAVTPSVDCSPLFVIHHESSNILGNIKTICDQCRENKENKDKKYIQASFTACNESGKRRDYNVSNDYCRIHSASEDTRLSSNDAIHLFQNCSHDRPESSAQRGEINTRIVISVICMSIIVILLSVYFGLMFHYRCFHCRN